MRVVRQLSSLLSSLWRCVWHCFWHRVCGAYPYACNGLAHLRRIIFQYDSEPTEIQTALAAIGSGLWIIWFGYLPTKSGSNFYHLLIHLLPDWIWSGTFVALGILQTVALLRNNIFWRAASAMVSFIVWAFVSTLLILSLQPGPLAILFLVFASSEAWVYLRLMTQRDLEVAFREVTGG